MPPRSRTPDEPDAIAAADDQQPDEQTGDTITLAVAHPYDSLVLHELDGLEITSDGVEVAADQEKAIRAAASEAGVRIRKVK